MANPVKTSDIFQDTGEIGVLIQQLENLDAKLEGFRKREAQQAVDLSKKIGSLNAATVTQREEIESASKQAEEISKRYKKYNESLGENAVKIAALKEAQRKQNQVNKLQAKLLTEKEGSYNQLSAQYSINKIKLNQLSKEERKNTDEGQELVKTTNDIYQEMKRLQAETGKTSLNVGNYTSAIGDASADQRKFVAELKATEEEFKIFQKTAGASSERTKEYEQRIQELTEKIDNLGVVTGKTAKDYKSGFLDSMGETEGIAGNAARGVKGLGKSFKALLANPVVLFVAAIASALVALSSAFSRSEKGAQLMAKATGVVNALMSQLVDVAVSAAEFMEAAFNDPLGAIKELGKAIVMNLLNRFKGLALAAWNTGKAIGQALSGSFEDAEKSAQKAVQSINMAITGLDVSQQQALADAIKRTTEEVIKETNAFIALEEQRRSVRRANRDLIRSIEDLTTAEELYSVVADDATRSFKEREEAAEKARKAAEGRAAKEIALAKNNLSVLNAEIGLRRANGEEVENLLDQQLDAYRQVIAAERELSVTTAQNEKRRSELKQDRLERDLDILIDGFDNQKTINERIIADEDRTLKERANLFGETADLAEKTFQKQIETIQQFTGVQIDANDLIGESDAVLLNEKIRNLGVSEIIEGRVLEIVRERRLANQDLAEVEKELIKLRKESLALPVIPLSGFEKKIIEETKSDLEEVKRIAARITEPPEEGPKDIYELLGFNIDDGSKQGIADAVGYVKDQIKSLTAARVEAANRSVEAANEEIAASQRALDIEIQNRNAGYANRVTSARRDLELAKKNQEKALKEQEKAQRAQDRIQTLEQSTSLATASAKIWASFAGLGPAGPFLAVGAIAAMWGSFIAAKIRASQLAKKTFGGGGLEIIGGGSHASGNDTYLGFESEGKPAYGERGEAHAIIPADKTRKYKDILPDVFESFRMGDFESKYQRMSNYAVAEDGSIVENHRTENVSVDMTGAESELSAIRRNTQRRYHTDSQGNTVETYKNLTRTFVKN